jgi:hypothetical protein
MTLLPDIDHRAVGSPTNPLAISEISLMPAYPSTK